MNKLIKAAKSRAVRASAVAVSLALAGVNAAYAAVDITAATTEAKTDIANAGGLIIGVVVAVAAISWIRRVIK